MDQSALWSKGAVISYVPYFDKTSDATTVAPICDLFYYIMLLVAVGTTCEYWRFPSTNTKQKLSCCRFLCTVHYNKRYVQGGVSQKPTIRHNTDTSVECDNAFYFWTWIIVMLLLRLTVWTRKIKGSLMKYVHFSFPLLHICLFWNVALISPDFELDFTVVIHSMQSFLQKTVELIVI